MYLFFAQVGITLSDGQLQQVSFVNGIATTRGGKHVDHVLAPIVNEVSEAVNKKSKGAEIKPFQIKNHIWVRICLLTLLCCVCACLSALGFVTNVCALGLCERVDCEPRVRQSDKGDTDYQPVVVWIEVHPKR